MGGMRRRVGGAWLALLTAGLLVAACGAQPAVENGGTGTLNLSSLPAAEVWIDGKAMGTTPVSVALARGAHDVVLKQAGFTEHRETVEIAPGAVSALEATLPIVDAGDPDAVRQLASAFGVTIEPFRAPELSRGSASDRGIALMYPRNDVRKEGLTSFRVDVTPAYDASGHLEFRKGKTSLWRSKFEPATLVTTADVPDPVIQALKVGDTVTWGVWFDDGRKPITAQFEIVTKPAATKKLADIAADKRLARQPAAVRQQLEAEVLQNYRLYTEALVRLLDLRTADKDNLMPCSGIVACLRRLELEDTGLFTETASKAVARISKTRQGNGGGIAAGNARPAPVVVQPHGAVPPASSGATPAPAAPAPTPAPTETTPSDPDPVAQAPTPATPPQQPHGAVPTAPPTPEGLPPRDPADPVVDPAAGPTAPGAQAKDPATSPPPQQPPTAPTAPGASLPPAPQAPGALERQKEMQKAIDSAAQNAQAKREAAQAARSAAERAVEASRAAPDDAAAREAAARAVVEADEAAKAAAEAQRQVDDLKQRSAGSR